jgi:lipoprotein NlpI
MSSFAAITSPTYSRGMALGRMGKSGAANTDFEAARALNPTIDQRFAKLGLTP